MLDGDTTDNIDATAWTTVPFDISGFRCFRCMFGFDRKSLLLPWTMMLFVIIVTTIDVAASYPIWFLLLLTSIDDLVYPCVPAVVW